MSKYPFTTYREAKQKILELASKLGVKVPSPRVGECNQQIQLLELAAGKPMNLANPSNDGPISRLSKEFSIKSADNSEISKMQSSLVGTRVEVENLKSKLEKLERRGGNSTAGPTTTSGPSALSLKELSALAEATFGVDRVRSLADNCTNETDYRDLLERNFHFSGLSVEGHSLAHVAQKYGPAKASFGLARITRARQQQSLNAWLAKNK